MKLLQPDDPRVVEISEDWMDFLELIYNDLPSTATAMSLGQVFIFLLQEYKPPMDELVPVLEVVMNVYSNAQNHRKQQMN